MKQTTLTLAAAVAFWSTFAFAAEPAASGTGSLPMGSPRSSARSAGSTTIDNSYSGMTNNGLYPNNGSWSGATGNGLYPNYFPNYTRCGTSSASAAQPC
jgi:hypothetical protein